MSDTPIVPEDWAELAPLLDRLLDAPPDAREALLIELAAGDPARGAALRHLLRECERPAPVLDGSALESFDQVGGEDEPMPLPPVLGGRYRLEHELGRGGMARVFLAQDLKHDRPVAVKVIRPELAASLGRDRFLREIGIAARLRHPNIMPLFDSGDVDGVLYFVMPYEAGQSLRARLTREGPLPIGDAISILRDLARALAHAHEQGVVHRDVKPDNVLLSGNAAVVTDFGIAKAFLAARTEAGSAVITQSGSVIGTPAYMSPEQGLGDPSTDHRTDIYGFGCLAYEVFTGTPPFAGGSSFQIVAAQMSGTIPSVAEHRSEVPPAIADLIARCLARHPGERPQSAAELLDGLSRAETMDGPVARKRARPWLAGAAVALLVVAGTAGILLSRDSGPVTVAVLPLLSRGGDSTQALVAEGFSEDLQTGLVKVPWIRVTSRRGAGNYRGQGDIDLKATGRALGARYLVMGSLRLIEGRQTLIVQLLSSEDETPLWAEEFDRPPDLAALRDRIVQVIGDSLRSRAGGAARSQVIAPASRHHPGNAAYSAYLMGKRKLSQRGQDLGGAIELFREAISLDSLEARAYSGLALALTLAPYFQGATTASINDEATASARRAIALDPTLSEPHIALGMLAGFRHEWDRSGSEYLTALERDPHDVEARIQYGRHLLHTGRLADAVTQLRIARDDDPASAIVASLLSHALFEAGQRDSARSEITRATRIDSLNLTTVLFGASLDIAEGRVAAGRRRLATAPPYYPETLFLLAQAGERATVEQRLAVLENEQPRRWLGETAIGMGRLGLGDTAQALAALERATDAGEMWMELRPVTGSAFTALRQSPRFRALLARIHLPSP